MQKKGGKGAASQKGGGTSGNKGKGGEAGATASKRSFSKPVNQSAFCIIPPESFWDPIQDIRAEHDKVNMMNATHKF